MCLIIKLNFFLLRFPMPFRTLLNYPTKKNSSAFCTYVENSEKFNFFQKSSKAMGQKIHQFNERVTRHRISKRRIISSCFYAIHMCFGDIRPRFCGWRWCSDIKKLGIVWKSVSGSHGEQIFFAIVKKKGSEKMRTIVGCGWAWMTKGAEIHKMLLEMYIQLPDWNPSAIATLISERLVHPPYSPDSTDLGASNIFTSFQHSKEDSQRKTLWHQ